MLPFRTGVGVAFGIVLEVLDAEEFDGGPNALDVVLITSLVAGIAAAEVGVGNDGVDTFLGAGLKVAFAVVVGVGEHFGIAVVVAAQSGLLRGAFGMIEEFAEDIAVLAALGEVGGGDDLVLFVDDGLGVVALDHALGGGHFRGLGVGDVAFHLLAAGSLAGLVFVKEGVDLGGFGQQLLRGREGLTMDLRLVLFEPPVAPLVLLHRRLGLLDELVALALEFLEAAAPFA